MAGNHLLPIGVDAKPTENDDAEVNKDAEENLGVNVSEVEEGKDCNSDDVDDEARRDPDDGGEDEVIVGGADADDEEGAGGEGDGGDDDGQHAVHN